MQPYNRTTKQRRAMRGYEQDATDPSEHNWAIQSYQPERPHGPHITVLSKVTNYQGTTHGCPLNPFCLFRFVSSRWVCPSPMTFLSSYKRCESVERQRESDNGRSRQDTWDDWDYLLWHSLWRRILVETEARCRSLACATLIT